MPNPSRYGSQFRSSPVLALWDLFGVITFGAIGAPTLVAANSLGITSISRAAVGQYLITLNNKYPALRGVKATFIAPGGAAAPDVSVETDSVASAGTLVINCQSGGVNADPASGETLLLEITLKNTTVAVG